MVNVVLVDSDPVLRGGLAGLLASSGDIRVVAAVADGTEALFEVSTRQPDVLITELTALPQLQQVTRGWRNTAVLVFSARDDFSSFCGAIRAGVRGYLHKSAHPASVLRAVRAVAAGEVVFGPHIAARLPGLVPIDRDPTNGLTARQRQIVHLVGEGLGNSAIAARLGVSTKTVSNQIPVVLAKLGTSDRATAIEYIRETAARWTA